MVKAWAFLTKVAVMEGNVGRLQADVTYRDLHTVSACVIPDEVPICAQPRNPFGREVRHSHESKFFHGCFVNVSGLEFLHENAQAL